MHEEKSADSRRLGTGQTDVDGHAGQNSQKPPDNLTFDVWLVVRTEAEAEEKDP
jgi:hypothetical protein